MDSNTIIFNVGFWMSTLSFTLIARWYLVPACRRASLASAVTPLLLLHSFRHMGLFYLSSAVVATPPPSGFSRPTAWGDLAAAGLALLALVVVRSRGSLAKPLLWVFNLVGFVDLVIAAFNAQRFSLLKHHIGVAYVLPVIVVPALFVSHGVVFWLLLRKEAVVLVAQDNREQATV